MPYTPTIWKDHILSENSYTITPNSDGTSSIKPAGTVVQQGTPMSAENFNHMEQGIAGAAQNADEALKNISEAVKTAKDYTDEKIAALINGAPDTLDTLQELAEAYQSASDLIAALQNYSVKKVVVYCPELTPSDGVCTWTINHNITTVPQQGYQPGQIIIQIYDSAGNQVACNIKNIVPGSVSVATFTSASVITARAYYAVCIG